MALKLVLIFFWIKYCCSGSQNSVMYRADLVRNRNPFYVETNRYADFEACFALLSGSDLVSSIKH